MINHFISKREREALSYSRMPTNKSKRNHRIRKSLVTKIVIIDLGKKRQQMLNLEKYSWMRNKIFTLSQNILPQNIYWLLINQHIHHTYLLTGGFPSGSVVKNQPANAGDAGSLLGSGRSPGVGNGEPL